jgi:hypothetical protein
MSRDYIIQAHEELSAVFACEKTRLDGREVDKLTAWFPADPRHRGAWPIHEFDPTTLRKISGSQFRARHYWFDPHTGLSVRYQCGCEQSKHYVTLDYPAPDALPPDLFVFRAPRGARVQAIDPAMDVHVEGEADDLAASGTTQRIARNAPPRANDQPTETDTGSTAAKPEKTSAVSGSSPQQGDGFLVMPIATELQRAYGKKWEKAKAYVLINGMAAFKDDDRTFDATAIDLTGLWESLEPYAKDGPGNVVFDVRCPLQQSPDRNRWPASNVFSLALEWFGRRVGFEDVGVEVRLHRPNWRYANDWESLVADVRKALPDPGCQVEKGVGDEQVKLYTIQTGLSRFLYGEDVDCVIHIIPPIDEAEPDIVQRMARHLPELNLKRKGTVKFLHHWAKAEIADHFCEEYCGTRVTREVLGFKSWIWTCRN